MPAIRFEILLERREVRLLDGAQSSINFALACTLRHREEVNACTLDGNGHIVGFQCAELVSDFRTDFHFQWWRNRIVVCRIYGLLLKCVINCLADV